MFKNHLAMIGYNESPNKKAKFWQSYIRSLKGKNLQTNLFKYMKTNGKNSSFQDPKTSAPTKAVKTTTVQDSQSTTNPRPLLVELPFQDTVIYQYIEKPMDTHHVTFTHIHHNDQVCNEKCAPAFRLNYV